MRSALGVGRAHVSRHALLHLLLHVGDAGVEVAAPDFFRELLLDVGVGLEGRLVVRRAAELGFEAGLVIVVVAILLDHFVSQAPLFAPGTAAGIAVPAEDEVDDDPADADIVAQIRELLETRIRPAVAGDGGDIQYRGFREGVVYLTMQGACSGCPSSTATLKHGIEGLLKHYVPEVTEVRAA